MVHMPSRGRAVHRLPQHSPLHSSLALGVLCPDTLELVLAEMIVETEAAHSSVVSGGFYSEGILSNQTPRKRYFFDFLVSY